MNKKEITLYISEDGDDSNEGTFEKPLWSVAVALDQVRWKSCETALFIISGSITEPAALNAMIDITGKGLPVISLQGGNPGCPGILNAQGLEKRVIFVADHNTLCIGEHIIIQGGVTQDCHGGAGITLEDATLIMRGGEISNNDCGFGLGGGVHVGNKSEFIMEGGLITRNKSDMHGGGVFMDEGGIFTMRDGLISGNTAYVAGGGVFVGVDSKFTHLGGFIKKNKAGGEENEMFDGLPIPYGEGGGVFVNEGGSFTLRNGRIVENCAEAFHRQDAYSGSGGGVFIDAGGAFSFEAGSIIQNDAMYWGGGVYTAESFTCTHKCLIGGNKAGIGGGGVHIKGREGTFTMKGGFLINNFAGLIGGAVDITEHCSFIMEGGVVLRNRAAKAGNIFITNGAVVMSGGVMDNEVSQPEENLEDVEFSMPSETAGTDVAIDEKGKLILKGGSFCGVISMKHKDQFEDLREKKGITEQLAVNTSPQ
ncbi:MAG: hypothetical protein LBP76_06585 [Treponema sp.]|nr:hypothetical protein [Treponema sp.]